MKKISPRYVLVQSYNGIDDIISWFIFWVFSGILVYISIDIIYIILEIDTKYNNTSYIDKGVFYLWTIGTLLFWMAYQKKNIYSLNYSSEKYGTSASNEIKVLNEKEIYQVYIYSMIISFVVCYRIVLQNIKNTILDIIYTILLVISSLVPTSYLIECKKKYGVFHVKYISSWYENEQNYMRPIDVNILRLLAIILIIFVIVITETIF